jgi:excisionase family DNA binding protein
MASVGMAMPRVRYGSAADLASYSGLSVKTIRRLVDAGKVRGRKVGRRLLIPFEDLDAHILSPEERRTSTMATAPSPRHPKGRGVPFVPPISAEELAARNRAAMALLDEWESDVEGEADQRETVGVLRRAFGPDRVASSREWTR